MEIVSFQENADPRCKIGDGLSRTSAAETQLFELKVWLPGQGAMRDLVRAESLQQAIRFAENRYPGCRVEVPEKVTKPRLVRSSVTPRIAAKRRQKIMREKQMQQEPAPWARKAWRETVDQQERADFLEQLYAYDGRDRLGHPMHGLYTGLYIAYWDRMDVQNIG